MLPATPAEQHSNGSAIRPAKTSHDTAPDLRGSGYARQKHPTIRHRIYAAPATPGKNIPRYGTGSTRLRLRPAKTSHDAAPDLRGSGYARQKHPTIRHRIYAAPATPGKNIPRCGTGSTRLRLRPARTARAFSASASSEKATQASARRFLLLLLDLL